MNSIVILGNNAKGDFKCKTKRYHMFGYSIAAIQQQLKEEDVIITEMPVSTDKEIQKEGSVQ